MRRRTGIRSRRKFVVAVLTLLIVLTISFGLGLGSVAISPGEALAIVGNGLGFEPSTTFTETQRAVLVSIRSPRVAMALLVGAALSVAGAALQGLFRNPLADPGLIGLTSGAAAGAGIVIVALGDNTRVLAAMGGWMHVMTPMAAFAGALLTTLLVYRLSCVDGRPSVRTMLLAGIAISSLAGAGLGFLSYLSDDASLRNLTLWMLGSLGAANWTAVALVAPAVVLATWLLSQKAMALNALLLGDAEAGHLGVDVAGLKRTIIIVTSLAVGITVAFTGPIGFVGLVVPHILRLVCGPDNRIVIPASALLGAALLLAADVVARTIAAPAEIPIGILTSLLGAPLFLWVLVHERGRWA
ncbi:MAG: FecCD family ABC transporter permease [Nannocystaceae bacterium]